MSDLKTDLMELHGIGEAKADDIMDVLSDHDTGDPDPLLAKAREAAEQGDDRKAAIYLRRAGKD